jgi:AcrR family transcriptional regulator
VKAGARSDDRRVRRTRDRLHAALIPLILEKGYDAVTIQDLLDRADVGRTTFYAHYRDKDDLLVAGLGSLRALLREHQRAALARGGDDDRLLGFSRAMFEHADEQRALFRAIVGRRAGTIVMHHVRRVFADLIRDDLAALAPKGAQVPVDALVEYTVGSLMSILTWWLDRRNRLTAPEADAMFRRLTIPGLRQALSR